MDYTVARVIVDFAVQRMWLEDPLRRKTVEIGKSGQKAFMMGTGTISIAPAVEKNSGGVEVVLFMHQTGNTSVGIITPLCLRGWKFNFSRTMDQNGCIDYGSNGEIRRYGSKEPLAKIKPKLPRRNVTYGPGSIIKTIIDSDKDLVRFYKDNVLVAELILRGPCKCQSKPCWRHPCDYPLNVGVSNLSKSNRNCTNFSILRYGHVRRTKADRRRGYIQNNPGSPGPSHLDVDMWL